MDQRERLGQLGAVVRAQGREGGRSPGVRPEFHAGAALRLHDRRAGVRILFRDFQQRRQTVRRIRRRQRPGSCGVERGGIRPAGDDARYRAAARRDHSQARGRPGACALSRDGGREGMTIESVLSTVNGPKWQRIGLDRKAGVMVPLWSLRTRRNAGIGEVLDLELLVDWCAATGQKLIQLLPVNDTAYDAPPYCSCSAFALNPVYLSLRDIPGIDPREVDHIRREFERQDRIVYYKIRGEKMRLLWGAYPPAKESLGHDQSFIQFCRDTAFWLDVYAVFM